MTTVQLRDIEVCTFDAYGTLFDYASAAERCKQTLGPDWQTVSDLWRRKQLEYTWLRSLMGRYVDFWYVTSESLDFALAAVKRQDPLLRATLMQQYLNLPCYPDVVDTLKALRAAGMRLTILSNGSPTMLTAAVNSTGISRLFEGVLSADAVQIYKPHPSVYRLVVDKTGVTPDKVCFVSSNGWDVVGAACFGFQAVWINRSGQPKDNLPAKPVAEVTTLRDLPALLGH